MRIRSIQNISNNPVEINLTDGNSVLVNPGQILENTEVNDISGVKKFLKVKYELGEVNPVREGKVRLND